MCDGGFVTAKLALSRRERVQPLRPVRLGVEG
jgi:hypothetical protein